MSLYELSKEVAIIEHRWDEIEEDEGGEKALALLSQLDAIYPVAEQKLAACHNWLRSLEADEDALAAEIKRLQGRKKALENKQKSIRGYVLLCMKMLSIDKMKAPAFTLSRSKGRDSLIVDESRCWEWPKEIFDKAEELGAVEVLYKVNKTELKRLPGYDKLPGVSVVSGDETLTIR